MKFFALLFTILAFVALTMAVKDPACALPHSQKGDSRGRACRGLIPSYTYKSDTNECVFFSYGGCWGNDNRFDNLEECQDKCVEKIH